MWLIDVFKHKTKHNHINHNRTTHNTSLTNDTSFKPTDIKEEKIMSDNNHDTLNTKVELDPTLELDLKLLTEPPLEIMFDKKNDYKIDFKQPKEIDYDENLTNKPINHVETSNVINEIHQSQYFYTDNGTAFKTIKEFYDNIDNLSDDEFNKHVENNNFVNWMRDIFKDYEAYKLLLYARTKQKYAELLKELFNKREQKKEHLEKQQHTIIDSRLETIKKNISTHENKIDEVYEKIDLISEKSNKDFLSLEDHRKEINSLKEIIAELKIDMVNFSSRIQLLDLKLSENKPNNELINLKQEFNLLQETLKTHNEKYDNKLKNFEETLNQLDKQKLKDKEENLIHSNAKTADFVKADTTNEISTKISQLNDENIKIKEKLEEFEKKSTSYEKQNNEQILKLKNIDNNLLNISAKTADFAVVESNNEITLKLKAIEEENKSLNFNIHHLEQLITEFDEKNKFHSQKIKEFDNYFQHLKTKISDSVKSEVNKDVASKHKEIMQEINKLKNKLEELEKEKNKKQNDSQTNNEVNERLKTLEHYTSKFKEALILLEKQINSLKNKNESDFKKLKEEISINLATYKNDKTT